MCSNRDYSVWKATIYWFYINHLNAISLAIKGELYRAPGYRKQLNNLLATFYVCSKCKLFHLFTNPKSL